ncbi:hypothetical protein B7494_g532 [Chlorociboria aeruginascens]|nr:hypothetical protein B7494_g532 [Chlorociboria aeruginascens]
MKIKPNRNTSSSEYTQDSWGRPMSPPLTHSQEPSYELPIFDTAEDEIKASWRSLFEFTTRQHTASLIFAGAATIGGGVLRPVGAIFFGNIFSVLANFGNGSLDGRDTLHQISTWCLALTILGIVAWLLEGLFLASWMAFGELQAKSVRDQMFTGLLEKDMVWYDLRKDGIASLMIRIQTQVRELQLAVSQPLGFMFFEVVGSSAALGTAFYYSWQLTLVIIATFPVAAGVLYLISLNLGPSVEAQKEELTRASKYANTAITAISTVKAFNGQDHEVWQYYSTVKRAAVFYLRQARANAMQFGIVKFLMVGIFVQGFWYGLTLVNKGLDPGHVLTTFYACLSAMQGVEIVLPQWLVLTKGMSAGATLKSIMHQVERGRKVTNMNGSLEPISCQGDIEIDNVSFAYPSNPRQIILSNATLFFPAGEITFVVGKSGSGKSTIGNLLMKYYEPLSGHILVDGHQIQTIDTNWLRNNVFLVQQSSVLFNESVLQNIAFGTLDHTTPTDITRACVMAGLEATIEELPEGLDTIVGPNGREMSGGQKQRISIARARLRDAPILILDESTSALDHTSRSSVMEAIRRWREGKTTIIITHDISQILDEDYVYVVDEGMVVQEGYRKKLTQKSHGTFAMFASSQSTDEDTPYSSPRRKSEPNSATFSEFSNSSGEESPSQTRSISKFFGMTSNVQTHTSTAMNIRSGNRMSLGVASAYANDLRTDNIWSSPIISDQSHFHIKSPSLPIPEDSSWQPHQLPSVKLPSRRGSRQKSITSISETATTSPKMPWSRPETLTIDTALAQSHSDIPIKQAEAAPLPEYKGKPEKLKFIMKPSSLNEIFRTIWPILLFNGRIILIIGFIAAFVDAAATPAFAFVFAKLLNVFYVTENQAAEARKWALSLLGIAVIDGVACYVTHFALEYCGESWVNSLRVEAFKRILNQPRSWFDKERNSAGRLNDCLDRNAEEMRNLIGRFAGVTFTVAWMLGISIVWSFLLSWRLTLVALGCAPVMYGITRIFNWASSTWENKCNEVADVAGSIFVETFANIRVVRALTLEGYFHQKHTKAAADIYLTGLSRATYSGLLYGLTDSASFFVTALIFYYGAVLISSGQHSVGTVIQIVNLLLFGIANSTALLALIPQINSSRTTATYMLYLVKLPYRASHEAHGKTRLATPLPIKFTSLSFTYLSRPHIRTLSDITLNLKANSCTAVVGPSGCGKSTLASLLLGLYPPDRPSIPGPVPSLTFNETSILDCNINSLRSSISIVSQTAVLFPTTIYENIIYGLHERSPYNNILAAKSVAMDVGIHDFIASLPLGYNTQIGEGGQGLSGGQAQRITIARALIRRPKILILDEATSALDNESAKGIRETVRKIQRRANLGEGMAILIISHDIEMMRIAEKVVVLEAGKMVEMGSFEELRTKGKAFQRLTEGGFVDRRNREDESKQDKERFMTPVRATRREEWGRGGSV